jgi:hypothetical protein
VSTARYPSVVRFCSAFAIVYQKKKIASNDPTRDITKRNDCRGVCFESKRPTEFDDSIRKARAYPILLGNDDDSNDDDDAVFDSDDDDDDDVVGEDGIVLDDDDDSGCFDIVVVADDVSDDDDDVVAFACMTDHGNGVLS